MSYISHLQSGSWAKAVEHVIYQSEEEDESTTTRHQPCYAAGAPAMACILQVNIPHLY